MRALIATGFLCFACSSEAPEAAPEATLDTFTGELTPSPTLSFQTGDAVVIAEVDGARIYDVQVARQAQGRGLSRAQGLDELIAFELLAKEAKDRGLDRDAEVVIARKRERVRRLLEIDFEPRFSGPDSVPDEVVDQLWQKPSVKYRFDHDEYRDISHILIQTKEEDPHLAQDAQTLFDRLTALDPSDKTTFAEEGLRLAEELGLVVVIGTYSTTRTGRAVEEFAKAAFDLVETGDMTGPVRTKYGYHILFLEGIRPAVHMSKEQAAAAIKTSVFEEHRRQAFLKWVAAHEQRARVVRHPDWEQRLAGEGSAQNWTPADHGDPSAPMTPSE